MAEIWIADDDASIRFVLGEALREDGTTVRDFASAEDLLAALDHNVPAVIVSDIRMPGASGLKLLDAITSRGLHLPVIVMSAFTDVASTATAYRNGAFDYLPKPFDLDQVRAAVERAMAQSRPPPAPLPATEPEAELIGSAPAMRELFRSIGRVAATDLNVLVTGETGTGK
ncbi:MAG: response regulator, partial [Proteobacteria bacterium]|nr:response regulator [Pseudomonadota bacterium]